MLVSVQLDWLIHTIKCLASTNVALSPAHSKHFSVQHLVSEILGMDLGMRNVQKLYTLKQVCKNISHMSCLHRDIQ